ncbi:MAG: DNA/RNA nuclease SfsA [Lachnospiraceae bacterium]|nr:DNA/RNA nuclease SfsA [Lachnospiraceae bacterium]
MKYSNIHTGIFRERPNRFIALVEMDGRVEKCHVKNTGRCRELLVPGAKVYLEKSDSPGRKTAYDLIGVDKGALYVNMDSQAPNKMVREWLVAQGWEYVRPEAKYGDSRIDFYMEGPGERRAFLEVKGVTLEEDGVARFPDAPTERGIKHMKELMRAVSEGYEGYILFVIQMKGVHLFEPNDRTHPAFGETLREAARAGVKVLAYDCLGKPGEIRMDAPVEVRLGIEA